MDIEYLTIGFLFLLIGIAIIIYKFRSPSIKKNKHIGYRYDLLGAAIVCIVLGLYLTLQEIKMMLL